MVGILQMRRKYQESFSVFNYLHLILLNLCVISSINHLMTNFAFLFALEDLFLL